MYATKGFGRLLSCLATLLSLVVLAGCLQSKTLLLGETDFVQPLPDEFTVFGYTQKDGVYALNVEDNGVPKKVQFSRSGGGYQPADEKGMMYFSPNGESSYLIAITDETSTYYGFAEIKGQLLVSRFISAAPQQDIERLSAGAGAEATEVAEGVAFENGSLNFTSRDTLLLFAETVRSGGIVLQGGPFYWLPGLVDGTDPANAPPAALDAEGNAVGG